MLIETQGLVQLRELFEKGREEINGMLDIV